MLPSRHCQATRRVLIQWELTRKFFDLLNTENALGVADGTSYDDLTNKLYKPLGEPKKGQPGDFRYRNT